MSLCIYLLPFLSRASPPGSRDVLPSGGVSDWRRSQPIIEREQPHQPAHLQVAARRRLDCSAPAAACLSLTSLAPSLLPSATRRDYTTVGRTGACRCVCELLVGTLMEAAHVHSRFSVEEPAGGGWFHGARTTGTDRPLKRLPWHTDRGVIACDSVRLIRCVFYVMLVVWMCCAFIPDWVLFCSTLNTLPHGARAHTHTHLNCI